jgi:hypothetical protein
VGAGDVRWGRRGTAATSGDEEETANGIGADAS